MHWNFIRIMKSKFVIFSYALDSILLVFSPLLGQWRIIIFKRCSPLKILHKKSIKWKDFSQTYWQVYNSSHNLTCIYSVITQEEVQKYNSLMLQNIKQRSMWWSCKLGDKISHCRSFSLWYHQQSSKWKHGANHYFIIKYSSPIR